MQVQSAFKNVTLKEVEQLVAEEVAALADMLGLASTNEVERLLRKNNWDSMRVLDRWQSLERLKRERSGASSRNVSLKQGEVQCLICFDVYPASDTRSTGRCKHMYCTECWKGYLTAALADGPAALDLKCPTPKCGVYVSPRLVKSLLDESQWERYHAYGLRSFIENNKRMCWCVSPGCESAVEIVGDLAQGEALDVTCSTCKTSFCFQCKDPAHRPVSCDHMRQWRTRLASDDDNMTYIVLNTKPCPKCESPIEKNEGCMHMTCRRCEHHFCWLCLGPWSEHGSETGGFYGCNIYEARVAKGEFTEQEKEKEKVKAQHELFTFHYERSLEHTRFVDRDQKKRVDSMDAFIRDISERFHVTQKDLRFIKTAWEQVVRCRRVLALSYITRFFQYEVPHAEGKDQTDEQRQAREFFLFLQGEAEHSLEQLHTAADKWLQDVQRFLTYNTLDATNTETTQETINEFLQGDKLKLIECTKATAMYFNRLGQHIERGVDDLQTDSAVAQETQRPDRLVSVAASSVHYEYDTEDENDEGESD